VGKVAIEFYETNAARFFGDSVGADMSATRARVLAHVPKGGAILEAGCGSGRDALAFKNGGYDVTAFDGSVELGRLASEHTGLSVLHKQFAEVDWVDRFDGVWACASLLHVARRNLPDAVTRLARSLRPGGVFYMSFKYGDAERFTHARPFTDMTEPLLTTLIEQCDLSLIEMWTSEDVRPVRKGEIWLSAIAKRSD
jgi:SAM-dependent methyltransferase